jgi:hypothetical protein
MADSSCIHLAPLEHELRARRLSLRRIESPYDDNDYRWLSVKCTFDGKKLKARLKLRACVHYVEYDGRAMGSDATFTCKTCKCVIMGLHPLYAGKAPVVV